MSLADELTAESSPEEPQYTPRTEWDGRQGFIQTAPRTTTPVEEEIIREFGYNPQEVALAPNPRVSRWQQRSFNKDTDQWETVWLTAYKYALLPNPLSVDLPALYAEIARTSPGTSYQPSSYGATVVVCWADIQTGKVDHLGGLSELLQRLNEKREALGKYLKENKFNHIVVCDVGDIVEGFENFPAQARTNSLSLMDQVDVAATEFWKTIRLCARHAPVDVLSIPSNHAQWRRGKDLMGKPTDDWGLYISKRLEHLNKEVGLRVTFHRPPEWSEVLCFDILGTKLGLAHGHQATRPDNIKTWWEKMTHSGVLDCHVLLTGHFHFLSLRPHGRDTSGKCRWHIQAPTLDNGSSWVRNRFGDDGDPALAVFRIDAKGFDVKSLALL